MAAGSSSPDTARTCRAHSVEDYTEVKHVMVNLEE
jgi:hypothetical protein